MFLLKAISKLFFASTKDSNVFQNKKSARAKKDKQRVKKHIDKFSQQDQEKIKHDRYIKLSSWQVFKLYLQKTFNCP